MEGITNSVWGPIYWKMFHYVTLTYPIVPTQLHIEKIQNFFCDIVPILLPCHICRKHYTKNLELNPLTDEILEIKFKLVIWLLNMHNYVNKQLGKDEMAYEDALVSLFIPEHIKEKKKEENSHYEQKNSLYAEDKLKKMIDNLVYVPSSENYNYNIDEFIKFKECQLKNKKEEEKLKKEFEEKEREKLMKEKSKEEIELIEKNIKKRQEEYQKYIQDMMNKSKLNTQIIDNNIVNIEVKKQDFINMNIVIEKILYYINKCDNDKDKYLIYTGFESICFIFN
jgi:hypothetical protein